MIKAVIFDCFGVLVSGTLEQFIESHFSGDEYSEKLIHEINDEASLGLISYEEQIRRFSELAGISTDQAHEEMDNNTKNQKLLAFITNELKNNYKIGFLSNASDNWLNELFDKDDLDLFNDFVLSYEVKMAKPDPRIYELSASRLGVETDNCIFVDDIERYCLGAQEVGMKTVHYKSFIQFEQEVKKLLADSDK
jgi:putative hydrolase of the HAD superfamily